MTMHRRAVGVGIVAGPLLLWFVSLFIPQSLPAHAQTLPDPIFVGAGDIANCDIPYDEATAKLLDVISGTIYTLGDNVYPDGTPQQFADCFEPTWGRHRARIKPIPGNHDYHTPGAAGYYSYFGAAASPLDENCTSNCKGYYSYELGAWHIIAINSEVPIDAASAEVQWLQQDLAAHPTKCTLAYWHEPRFSSGVYGNDATYATLWSVLYAAGVEIVLNGHEHSYERFAPQNPFGEADPLGIRQFIVGTGGINQRQFLTVQPNSEVRATDSWGVLQFTLHATAYDWDFIPIAGQSFHDTGHGDCIEPDRSTMTLERRVGQSSDDGEEGSHTTPVYLTSSDLELTVDLVAPAIAQTVGLRFTDLALGHQATIKRAFVEFTVDETGAETTTLQIAGEATGNAATFAVTPGNLSQRPLTTALVAWPNIPAWHSVGASVRTPDLTPIIQEIVNRNDWAVGHALSLIIRGTGQRIAVAFDGNPLLAPLLHVEYTNSSVDPPQSVYDLYLPLMVSAGAP